jgi:hypothetical protein
MNVIAVLCALAFGASPFIPMPKPARFVVYLLALLVGFLFLIFGGFSYWWDRSMRPTHASAVPFVCGLAILASQVGVLVRSYYRSFFP